MAKLIVSLIFCLVVVGIVAKAQLEGGDKTQGETIEDQINAYVKSLGSAYSESFSQSMRDRMSQFMASAFMYLLEQERSEGKEPTMKDLIERYKTTGAF